MERRSCLRGDGGETTTEAVDVLVERKLEHVDVPPPPELALKRLWLGLHDPGSIAERILPPETMEDDAQVPVGHRVAEKEKVAPPQLRCERHRDYVRELALREIADVVVLGDDEALPLARR